MVLERKVSSCTETFGCRSDETIYVYSVDIPSTYLSVSMYWMLSCLNSFVQCKPTNTVVFMKYYR